MSLFFKPRENCNSDWWTCLVGPGCIEKQHQVLRAQNPCVSMFGSFKPAIYGLQHSSLQWQSLLWSTLTSWCHVCRSTSGVHRPEVPLLVWCMMYMHYPFWTKLIELDCDSLQTDSSKFYLLDLDLLHTVPTGSRAGWDSGTATAGARLLEPRGLGLKLGDSDGFWVEVQAKIGQKWPSIGNKTIERNAAHQKSAGHMGQLATFKAVEKIYWTWYCVL